MFSFYMQLRVCPSYADADAVQRLLGVDKGILYDEQTTGGY